MLMQGIVSPKEHFVSAKGTFLGPGSKSSKTEETIAKMEAIILILILYMCKSVAALLSTHE
jgi:hypothetical protein